MPYMASDIFEFMEACVSDDRGLDEATALEVVANDSHGRYALSSTVRRNALYSLLPPHTRVHR